MITKEELKQIFQKRYTDIDFTEQVLRPVFGDKFRNVEIEDMLESYPDIADTANEHGIVNWQRIGEVKTLPGKIDIFDITVTSKVQMHRNRISIQSTIHKVMRTVSSAFMIFHYETGANWDWRFTFYRKQGAENSDPKRYTFLLGPDQSCRTAAENFMELANHNGTLKVDDIQKAFDVEALSKEFFNKYKEHYDRFCAYVYNNRNNQELFGEEFTVWEDKTIRDYVKKLLGRIVFLHFLQKKGWLGVPADKPWGEGDRQFMKSLFDKATDEQKANYLDEVLEPMFNDLDTQRNNDIAGTWCNHLLLSERQGEGFKIPYLNGGLFERDKLDEPKSTFSSDLFADLFNFLYQYNFTIDENDPNDAEVGVDPEMLGRIFENLLEDNKDKGAFYTPKEIVQYMCKESLIAYLQTDIKSEDMLQRLRDFVCTYDVELLGGANSQTAKDVDVYLKAVKICDPAIGSGAFPMGLMKELYMCRSAIEGFGGKKAVEIKKHIIQQNIYGVDIEKGAVDIARLRFWLSLVLDEETPHALPNLDFKIMQGNSLLEQYKGVDLSKIIQTKKDEQGSVQLQMFDDEVDILRAEIKNTINKYYSESNHEIRRSMRKGIQQKIQQQIALQSINVDISDISDIASTDQFFLWHTWFADVFEENGGFDIVIGNPPYIRHEKLDIKYKHLLCSVYPNVGEGTADILVYFFGLGINILSGNGILNFITSNKFLKTKYGKSLRNTLASDVDVLSFIDFFELPVFNNASTDAGITLLRKDAPTSETKYYPVLSLNNLDLDALTKGPYQHTIKNETEWQFVRAEEHSILNKLNENSIPLTNFVNNRIYSGVKTGLNGTFMLTKEVRDMILSRCLNEDEYKRTDNVIKKAFRSRDIRKYVYSGPQIWLLFIPWHFPLPFEEAEKMRPEIALELAEQKLREEYPSLYSYLCDNKEDLSGRNKDETGIRYEWYALQRWGAKYYKEFDEEKLIYIHTAKNHEFYYDTEKHYVNNSCYIIASQSKFLYCFLNSKLFSYYKRIKFVAYGNGAEAGRCKLDGNKMATVPIRVGVEESVFNEKYEELQRVIEANPQADTSALEAEIDRLVYALYGLTPDEIAIVEGKNE